MNNQVKSPAQLHREQVQHEALKIGIDEDYISVLVDTFYDRIRSHEVLGPIFADAIGSNWEPHLEKMKQLDTEIERFSGLELTGSSYSGVGIPACIENGQAAANRILEQIEQQRPDKTM